MTQTEEDLRIDDGAPPDDIDDDADGGGDEPVRWITIATFSDPMQAHIARLKLESEQIPCMMADENLVSTDWLLSNAVGGIKLQVPVPDAARAQALLHPSEPSTEDEPSPDACPRCGSHETYRAKASRKLALWSLLLLGLPLLIPLPVWRCSRCAHEWRQ